MKRIRFGEEEQVVEAVDSITTANVLMLLSRGGGGGGEETDAFSPAAAAQAASRVFECKTCSRKFPSFQALGGHRASHKKPRPAADGIGPNGPADGPNGPAKARVHECSICGLEFAIGQALGGHMRRHRAAAAAAAEAEAEAEAEKKPEEGRRMLWVDLNLTPLENDMEYCRKTNLGLKIVDNIPMVGCLH